MYMYIYIYILYTIYYMYMYIYIIYIYIIYILYPLSGDLYIYNQIDDDRWWFSINGMAIPLESRISLGDFFEVTCWVALAELFWGYNESFSQPINECCFHIPLKRWMLVMLVIHIYIYPLSHEYSMKSLYEWAIVGSYPYFSWYHKRFLWSPWPTVRAFFLRRRWLGRWLERHGIWQGKKVSTNWAKVPILGGLQCHQERGNVATFKENLGRQKKMYSEWQIDHSYQSICLLSNQLTYQKKRHFFLHVI